MGQTSNASAKSKLSTTQPMSWDELAAINFSSHLILLGFCVYYYTFVVSNNPISTVACYVASYHFLVHLLVFASALHSKNLLKDKIHRVKDF